MGWKQIWTELKFYFSVDCVYWTMDKTALREIHDLKAQVIAADKDLSDAKRQFKIAKKQKHQQCAPFDYCTYCDGYDCEVCGNEKLKIIKKCPYNTECMGNIGKCCVLDKHDLARKERDSAQQKYDMAVQQYKNYTLNAKTVNNR